LPPEKTRVQQSCTPYVLSLRAEEGQARAIRSRSFASCSARMPVSIV
jgi:hypothetical protein